MSSEGTPLHGDRSAWNVMDFDTKHAKDIMDSTLRRHLPLPGAAGGLARSDGTDWQRVNSLALADLAGYARGYIIRGGASDWEPYSALTDGAALVGDGTDIISDLTPLWKGKHTFNDGFTFSANCDGTGTFDINNECALAGGDSGLQSFIYQADGTGMTGTLRGAYLTASGGNTANTGTIRGAEIKARAGRPGEAGNDVAVLEGFSISSDAKTYGVTTHRGGEIILDGGAGTSTLAVGLRIANNFQADRATVSYGLQIYRDSFDYTADIQLSHGHTVADGASAITLNTALAATGFTIGANTLTTSEWANLDGLDQTVATTSSPSFTSLTILSGGDIDPTDAASQYLGDPTHLWNLCAQEIFIEASITMADNTWQGIGDAAGRIIYDDTPVPDEIKFADCNVIVGDGTIFGIGPALERFVFDAAGDIAVMGANLAINTLIPSELFQVHNGEIAFSDSDVSHPMTGITAANVYGHFRPHGSTTGGLRITGLTDGDFNAFYFRGILGTTNPTDTTAAIVFVGGKSNGGTGWTALGASETVIQYGNYNIPVMTILGSGYLGLGTVTPLRGLHIQGTDLGVNTAELAGVTDVMFVLEGTDAFFEFVGLDAGSWLGGFAFTEMSGAGAMLNKWSIARQTTGAGDGGLYFAYGTNANPWANTSVALLTTSGRFGVGATPTGQIHIDQASTTAAIPVAVFDQADVSEPFTNYIGTSAASAANSLSSWTTGNAVQGHIQIDINGVKRWLRYYDDPTS